MGASKTLKQSQQRQVGYVDQSQNLGNQLYGQSQGGFTQRNKLLEKPIEFNTAMASGDVSKMMAAAAPALANISKGAHSAAGAIRDTAPAGAARSFALAQLERDKYSKNADFLNQAYMSSFPALQGIASDTGNLSLQQLGAGMRGYESASQGNQMVMQTEAQRQAAKMNMIGGLATIAGGGVFGAVKGMKPKG